MFYWHIMLNLNLSNNLLAHHVTFKYLCVVPPPTPSATGGYLRSRTPDHSADTLKSLRTSLRDWEKEDYQTLKNIHLISCIVLQIKSNHFNYITNCMKYVIVGQASTNCINSSSASIMYIKVQSNLETKIGHFYSWH